MSDRLLPQDLSIERAFLAGILTGGEAFIDWSVSPDDFYKVSHQKIFDEMCKSSRGGLNPDAVTVAAFLPKELFNEIYQIVDCVTSPSLNWQYAKIIKDLSLRRKLILGYYEAREALFDTSDTEETLEKIDSNLNQISANTTRKKKGVSIENVYYQQKLTTEYDNHIERLKESVFATGFQALDETIRGLAGGEVLTILARSGCFKTAFLQHLMLKGNEDSLSVFFSLEMPVASVFERFSQSIIGKNGREVEQGWLADRMIEQTKATIDDRMKNIAIIPTRPTIKQMERYIYLIEKKLKKRVGLIGIDYLGLADGPGDSEYAKNSAIAVDVKIMAKSLNVPVILLSQLSRKGGDGTERVTLDMARGSGQIEEAADFIFGMWKNMKGPEDFDLILTVLKNRKGPINKEFRLNITPEFMQFNGCDKVTLVNSSQQKRGFDS